LARSHITAPPDASAARTVPAAPLGRKPLRTFALATALPAVLLYVACAATIFFVLGTMGRDIDRLEDARGITQMHAALDSFLNGLAGAVADEGTWDEAYLNVVVSPNPAWMDTTWGSSARLGQSYDAALVTDNDGNVVFGEDGTGPLTGKIDALFPAAAAMLSELDKAIGATGDATTVAHFAADKQGAAALAAISIHQSSQTAQLAVSRQNRRILWIVRHVTPAVLQDIASHDQTPLAELVDSPGPDQSAISIADATGNNAGSIAWVPDRPGDAAFIRATLLAAVIFLAIGVALVIVLGIARRAVLRSVQSVEAAVVAVPVGAIASTAAAAPHLAPVAAGTDARSREASPIDGVVAADFEIEYEPVFDLRAQTMTGVEMRLRWRKSDKSLLRQEDLATDQNIALLDRVGVLALRRATDDLAPLLGMTLSVTVAPAQLLMGVFAEKLAATLSATSFPGKRLQLCIDASRLPSPDDLAAAVARLKRSGVAVGLANFALSSATTPYMRAGLVDAIRLHRDMVAGVDGDAARLLLLETTIAVARSIDCRVTAPFVARKEEVARLLRLDCGEFEGPLFAAPMPIASLTSLILSQPLRRAS
jgi:EAL domain-containing protein (putative c-di-GMP-specific phosphodiesterase class I)